MASVLGARVKVLSTTPMSARSVAVATRVAAVTASIPFTSPTQMPS